MYKRYGWIPGFKNEEQVEQNSGAIQKGPLSTEQMAEIERLIGKKQ
jgi:aryl-alcohol dehydrogenase-like predicted oxidoreductase